jgi:hypothetical protein
MIGILGMIEIFKNIFIYIFFSNYDFIIIIFLFLVYFFNF